MKSIFGAKSLLGKLPEAFPDAIVIVDSRGQILEANARAASLFGFGERQLNGKPIQALFPDQPVAFPGARPGQRDQAGWYLQLRGRSSDSSQFPVVVAAMPIEMDHGTAIVMSIRDLSEAHRTQFILRRGAEILMSDGRDRRALLRRLIRAKEEERARIASEIHDESIQMVIAVSLRLQRLRLRLLDKGTRQILDEIQQALNLSLSHLRQLIFDLRPPDLENGLGAAMRVYLEQMTPDTGIAYRLNDRLSAHVPDSTAMLIYRNVREALANARKHARANAVLVEFLDIADGCLVRIVDDGVGYHPADIEDRPGGHLGLVLMRERAELAGGWCRIESSPGSGTTVEFWVPLGESSTPSEC
jgi:PAS domain S-box-containing protein